MIHKLNSSIISISIIQTLEDNLEKLQVVSQVNNHKLITLLINLILNSHK